MCEKRSYLQAEGNLPITRKDLTFRKIGQFFLCKKHTIDNPPYPTFGSYIFMISYYFCKIYTILLSCFLANCLTSLKYTSNTDITLTLYSVMIVSPVGFTRVGHIKTIIDKSNIHSHTGAALQSESPSLNRRRRALPFSFRLPPRSAIMKS